MAHWDKRLLSMLKACPSPRAVLTTYPPGYHLPDLIPDEAVTPVTVLAAAKFSPTDGMLRYRGRALLAWPPKSGPAADKEAGVSCDTTAAGLPRPKAPLVSRFWAAGRRQACSV